MKSTLSTEQEQSSIGNRHGQVSPISNGSAWAYSGARPTNGTVLTNGDVERISRALGWFSIGLGLAQIAVPEKIAQMIGVRSNSPAMAAMRAVGLREIASGFGILTQPKPTPWLWARVGGDAMDLALLKSARSSPQADQHRLAAATAAVLGIAAVDTFCSTQLSSENDVTPTGVHHTGEVPVKSAITVNAPIDQVYATWEGFRDLPHFMKDLASVEVTSDRTSRWKATLPGGLTLGWDVEITNVTPSNWIQWQTSEGSGVHASGQVRFRPAPGDRGTEVLFDAKFNPPGGELGSKIGGLFADALGQKVQNDLRRSKQLIEIGEIVQSDDSIVPGPNPAQPVANSQAA